jgi:hypothetical protein
MNNKFTEGLSVHINFLYTSFDRIILRGYVINLFVEGFVIKLLLNLGFSTHSNGVIKLLTDQLNAHIKKVSKKLDIQIHWWVMRKKKNIIPNLIL